MTESLRIKKKYSRPPTVEEILSFISEVGLTYAHFEYYYGIASGTIRHVKWGDRSLPTKYWKIFHERIKPDSKEFLDMKYGVTKSVSKKVTKLSERTKSSISHDRIGNIKTK